MLISITLISIALAVAASVIAFRAAREERRRSEARVAALSNAIHGRSRFELDLRPGGSHTAETAAERSSLRSATAAAGRSATASAEQSAMFTSIAPDAARPRIGLVLSIVGFLAASLGAAAIVLGGASSSERPVAGSPAKLNRAEVRDAAAGSPLELVSLAHEREGDRLTVRGTIRNPASGLEMDRLTAVVFLFDRDGNSVASGRAPVDAPALIPGGESTFAVTVPAAGEVAKYRVSFRAGDRIVAHVDRRNAS
jgi:hypothetical protein